MWFSTQFAEVDAALRAGRHVTRHDLRAYEFIWQNFDTLEKFYATYKCKLVQHPDGFFFLFSKDGLIPTRKLSRAVMHLGAFIALKTRDPDITTTNGWMEVEALIADLEAAVHVEVLSKIYAPRRREGGAGDKIRGEILRSLAQLERMNFVRREENALAATPAIYRFAELARHRNNPSDLEKIALETQRGVIIDPIDDESEDPT